MGSSNARGLWIVPPYLVKIVRLTLREMQSIAVHNAHTLFDLVNDLVNFVLSFTWALCKSNLTASPISAYLLLSGAMPWFAPI